MTPSITIIIPSYNRPEQLRHCLESFTRLDYPQDRYDIVVVDDGSAKPLEPVVASFEGRLSVSCLRQDNQGPAAARNTGIARARGDFIAFTDDDCEPDPTWLSCLAKELAATPDRMVGGRTINVLKDNAFSEASQMIIDVVYARYNGDHHNASFFANNNFALSKALFAEVGGFAEDFRTAEDREFCDRWRHHGYRLTYVPEAVIYHSHHLTLGSYCRQHFAYGRGAHQFHQARARRGSGTMQPEAKFHMNVGVWLDALKRQPTLWTSVKLSLLMVVWRFADLAGYLRQRFGVPS